MRKSMAVLAALTMTAAGLAAQDAPGIGLRLAPQYMSYSIGSGSKVKINELAIPVAFMYTLNSQFSVDVASAFANATVDDGTTKSTISGLTDAQVRLNYSAGAGVVITAGLNIPSGQYKVAEDKIAAAGEIGNDFLAFPVSSFGNGFAGTGGVALARTAGSWNLGLGASFRHSVEFDAFETDNTTFRFTPGDEIRVRLGGDHELSNSGRMMVGVVFSSFGKDKAQETTYSTGSRIIGQAAFDVPVSGHQLYIGGWLLHHASGERLGGTAPAENIENVLAALGLHAGTLFVEPSVELRFRQADGADGSSIVYGGLRTKLNAGSLEISPSVAYGKGSIEGTDISSIKGGITIRYAK
ncbi:MAG TPA: hypothetical protein VE967_15800 [Gemmatimonadaceae bacterium]|nr:hypothetical protein [Gemmatimonadaceae bacterium]